jgi:hypothetical protein
MHLMHAVSNLEGSCPVCGANVARQRTMWNALPVEVYTCPTHGRIEYSPQSLSLLEDAPDELIMPALAPSGLVWEV